MAEATGRPVTNPLNFVRGSGAILNGKNLAADTVNRFSLFGNGAMQWSTGSAAQDIGLQRTAGTNGGRVTVYAVGATQSAQMSLEPGASVTPAGTITSQILLYNVIGTNYERAGITFFSNEFVIDSDAGGSGTYRQITIQTEGTKKLLQIIPASGYMLLGQDTYKVGVNTSAPSTTLEYRKDAATSFSAGAWGGSVTPTQALTISNGQSGGYDTQIIFRQATTTGVLKPSGVINMMGLAAWTNGTLNTQISAMMFLTRDTSDTLIERFRFNHQNGVWASTTGLGYSATSPAQITSNQNDYAIGTGIYFRINSDAARNITGITGGFDGRRIVISNVGGFAITLTNQDAASTAANRIITGTGANLSVAVDVTVALIYDATTQRWRIQKNA